MLKHLSEAVDSLLPKEKQAEIDPNYANYLVLLGGERLKSAVNIQGMKSDVVIGLLQGACQFEPDPSIRQWAQGLLKEHGLTPHLSVWPTVGCDGKVYSRAEMLAVRGLTVI